MNSSQARQVIYRNMDSIALALDIIDSVKSIKNNADFIGKNIIKLTNERKESNRQLELISRHRVDM